MDPIQTRDLPAGTLGFRDCQQANLKSEIGRFGLSVRVGDWEGRLGG